MKQIYFKLLAVLLLVVIGQTEVKASHLTGGEIVWECLPTGQYRFTLVLYRDCTGATAPTTAQSLVNTAGVSIICSPILVQYINPECSAPPCNTAPNGYKGAMERHVYRSGPVTLTGAPPAGGWVFSWSSCCRPSTGNLSNQDSYYLRATMFQYTPPGSGTPLTANPCYDSSPNFLEAPAVTVCTNQSAEYLALGFDSDLDSLYYDWEPAKTGIASNAPYKAGYTFTSPLPSAAPSVGAVMDHQLGRITFKSAIADQFAVATKIQEYRCGQLIGEIVRDLVIVTKACVPPPGGCSAINSPPTLNFQWYPGFDTLSPVLGPGNKIQYYEMSVYARTPIKFKMVSSDFDLQPSCTSQQIKFVGQGGQLSSATNYNNPNTCFFTPPCATMTSLNTNGLFVNGLNNDVEFNWQTTCDHLTFQAYACGGLRNTYEFFFRFEDNACPLPAFSYATVKINVLNYPPVPPDLSQSCITTQTNNGLQFDWTMPLDTGINFDYYVIYRSNAGGPFTAIDSIYNYLTTSYVDVSAPAGNNQYFMRTKGGCGLTSIPSDTIQNIELTLVSVPPPPNSSVAMLSWNAKKPSGPAGEYYQIWRQICGSAVTWELVDSTQTLAYNDTVNVCGDCLNYQIRIKNSCNSTEKNGFFADQTNNDIIVIDSVSVVSGIANIAWDTSNVANDIIDYIILKEDNNGFWIPIDTVPRGTAMPYIYTASLANTMRENFKVVTLDSCGNQSSDLTTSPHNTLFLRVNADPCESFVRLRWNTYRQWTQTGVGTYEILADITDNLGVTTNGVSIFKGGPTDTVYDHTALVSGSKYCYTVRAVDTTGRYSSTSNQKCIDALVVQKSRLLYLARATVKLDGSIETYAFIDQDADVIDYGIERADNPLGPFFVMGRVPKPTQPPFEIKYSDYSATPESRKYYYRISSRDSCGALDTISNIGRNILLKAKSNGNLSNTLAWNPYEKFDGTVGKYQIYRMIDQNGAWSLAAEVGGSDTVFVDNIRPLGNTKGSYCYYVVGVETGNTLGFLDEFGQPFSSTSNQVCVVQETRIFIPTAFNPNSDIAENRVWKPSNVFAKAESYEMFVTNRWGEKIYQTTNPKDGWDGNFKGEQMPLGVYTYYIRYRSYEGLPIEERGTFTLIR